MIKITAKEFHERPKSVYRAADKGERVIINHDRYEDIVFEIIARERRTCLPEHEVDNDGG